MIYNAFEHITQVWFIDIMYIVYDVDYKGNKKDRVTTHF